MGFNSTAKNYGTIQSSFDSGNSLEGERNVLFSFGRVEGAQNGIGVFGGGHTISNAGLIRSGSDLDSAAIGAINYNKSRSLKINNKGTINGGATGIAYAERGNGPVEAIFVNKGSIFGDILFGSGNDTFENGLNWEYFFRNKPKAEDLVDGGVASIS